MQCLDCQSNLHPKILECFFGFYVGYRCPCGFGYRLSNYYLDKTKLEVEFKAGTYPKRELNEVKAKDCN